MQLQYTRHPEPEEPSTASPAGQVRVLIVGDSGVGKTSLVNLIVNCRPCKNPPRTVGCNVTVKYVDLPAQDPNSQNMAAARSNGQRLRERPVQGGQYPKRGYFVELWDVSGLEDYKSSRSIFYSQINGVIFVHDMSRRKTRVSALRWLAEVAKHGTFSSPSMPRRPGMLPVPLLVIGNKGDIMEIDPVHRGATKLWEMMQGSASIRAAQTWAEKQQWLGLGMNRNPEMPDYIRNPHSSGLVTCAKEGRLDMKAVMGFFVDLIERRYYMEHMAPLPSPSWSWLNPYFTPLSATSSGASTPKSEPHSDSIASTPRAHGGFDPMLSTVRGAQSRLVQLQDSPGRGRSYEWASDTDQHSIRVDDELSLRSNSQASLDTLEGRPHDACNPDSTKPRSEDPPTSTISGEGSNHSAVDIDGAPIAWSREEGLFVDSLEAKTSWSSFATAQDEAAQGTTTASGSLPPFHKDQDPGHGREEIGRQAMNAEDQRRDESNNLSRMLRHAQMASSSPQFTDVDSCIEFEAVEAESGRPENQQPDERNGCRSNGACAEKAGLGEEDAWMLRQQQEQRCHPAFRHDKHLLSRVPAQTLLKGSSPQREHSPKKMQDDGVMDFWGQRSEGTRTEAGDQALARLSQTVVSRAHSNILDIRA